MRNIDKTTGKRIKSLAWLVDEINNRGISSLDKNWHGGEFTVSRKYIPYLVGGYSYGLLQGEIAWCDAFTRNYGKIKCVPFAWRPYFGYCNAQQRMIKDAVFVRTTGVQAN